MLDDIFIGDEFSIRIQFSVPIEVGTRRDVIEYGVCTRVVSDGAANGFQGLCPKPTNCVAARDKHICSCGVDQFVDVVNNNTVCSKISLVLLLRTKRKTLYMSLFLRILFSLFCWN